MKSYPVYKDSGVEWLGNVPAGWEVKALRSIAKAEKKSFIDGDWIESPFITDDGIRLLQTGNVGVGVFKEQGFRFISEETFSLLNCTEVFPGDILICRLAEPVGRACVAPSLEHRMITSVDVAILKPLGNIDPKFLVFLMSSAPYLSYMESQCRGGTRDRVSRSFLGGVKLPLPPPSEQRKIATFLDQEVAKIDDLIEEQRRLIALLAEKRQATISHAVTKGLNPNAKLKPSGIDWLGDVPEGWDVVHLRRIISMKSGESITADSIEPVGDYPVYGGNGLRGFTNSFTHEGLYCLIGRQGALCGNINYAQGKFWASEHAIVVTPQMSANVTWLGETLRAMNLNQYSTSAAQPGLSVEQLNGLALAFPPREDQNVIADYLERDRLYFEELTEVASSAITLLQERRSALISAAVTGKIDLRDFDGSISA